MDIARSRRNASQRQGSDVVTSHPQSLVQCPDEYPANHANDTSIVKEGELRLFILSRRRTNLKAYWRFRGYTVAQLKSVGHNRAGLSTEFSRVLNL